MLIANLPIRPVPSSGGLGGFLPTSPTPYGLKYAFYNTVQNMAELITLTMSVWGTDSTQTTEQLKELDALIKTLGDSKTAVFFYHSEQGIESNYIVGFDNPNFNHDLDPNGEWDQYKEFAEKKLFPEEIKILKLKEVQNVLARFRDAAQIARTNEDTNALEEESLPLLIKNLDRILQLGLRHLDSVTGKLVNLN